ncbi:hypothetical protein KCP77_08300 [Salmonella enterica subsp. enterica]|nr:hypothetical protein KCP77_08300 [Salmonella enterica subsp. enterica]
MSRKGYVALAFWLGSLFAEQPRTYVIASEIVGEPGTVTTLFVPGTPAP